MVRRLDPRLGVDNEGPRRLLLRDEDAVEADVQHADAVRQAAHLQRDAAREAVAPLHLRRHAHLAAGRDRRLRLRPSSSRCRPAPPPSAGRPPPRAPRPGRRSSRGPSASAAAPRRHGRRRVGEQGETGAGLAGRDRRRRGAEARRQVVQPHLDRPVEVVDAVGVTVIGAAPPLLTAGAVGLKETLKLGRGGTNGQAVGVQRAALAARVADADLVLAVGRGRRRPGASPCRSRGRRRRCASTASRPAGRSAGTSVPGGWIATLYIGWPIGWCVGVVPR